MEDSVLVVGGGTMGMGIALACAAAGCSVTVVEPDVAARERAAAQAQAERVCLEAEIPQRSDAALAIEAVSEDAEIKRDVFRKLGAALSRGALVATNTSSLSVGDLAAVVPNPERVVGMHFFNPVSRMKLVEIVPGELTSGEAVDRACGFAERIGKTPVVAEDTPGFIVNRVARPYYLQSLRALERGVASAEELDALARGAGFRMGPFELMDLIGLDINLATTESVYERTDAARLAPVAIQREMVAAGRLGRKSGAGFYSYREGTPQRFEPAIPETGEEPNAQEQVAIVGFGGIADEIAERAQGHYAHCRRIEHDAQLDEISQAATIVFDVGDGSNDRSAIVAELDTLLGEETILFVDAYASDLDACASKMRHPERLVGYGILGSLEGQRVVEIVDTQSVSDDALGLAEEFFGVLGKGVVLVENVPGLFLGRAVASVVNEAAIAVQEGVASPEDVDTAMRLGANYPIGPIAWGREIGGARLMRILKRLARDEGEAFAPHRSLWLFDLDDPAEQAEEPA